MASLLDGFDNYFSNYVYNAIEEAYVDNIIDMDIDLETAIDDIVLSNEDIDAILDDNNLDSIAVDIDEFPTLEAFVNEYNRQKREIGKRLLYATEGIVTNDMLKEERVNEIKQDMTLKANETSDDDSDSDSVSTKIDPMNLDDDDDYSLSNLGDEAIVTNDMLKEERVQDAKQDMALKANESNAGEGENGETQIEPAQEDEYLDFTEDGDISSIALDDILESLFD